MEKAFNEEALREQLWAEILDLPSMEDITGSKDSALGYGYRMGLENAARYVRGK